MIGLAVHTITSSTSLNWSASSHSLTTIMRHWFSCMTKYFFPITHNSDVFNIKTKPLGWASNQNIKNLSKHSTMTESGFRELVPGTRLLGKLTLNGDTLHKMP